MIFLHKRWDKFCSELAQNNKISVTANSVETRCQKFIVLKHDVEKNVKRAYQIADIESRYGHKGSYYVQGYLLKDEKNVMLLKKMKQMGHEISYHHDVMDSAKGNINKAKKEFDEYKSLFENNDFIVSTVCQHGNPVVERDGYTSNRDFFRTVASSDEYKNISDIMVNFQTNREINFKYFSDAGRQFKLIHDPINNDIDDTSDLDIKISNLEELTNILSKCDSAIVSIHPHRWSRSLAVNMFENSFFYILRSVARTMKKFPFVKNLMSKYYYLAKQI